MNLEEDHMNIFVRWWTLLLLSFALGPLFVGCSGGASQEEFDENLMNQEEGYENEEYNNENEYSDEGENQNFDENNLNNQNFDSNENNENLLNEENNFNFQDNNIEEVVSDDIAPEEDLAQFSDNNEVTSYNNSDAYVTPVSKGAAGEASSLGLPELGSKMPYVVQKGDSLSKIAKKVFGSFKEWRSIAELSDLENPNLIYPGEVVYYQLSSESLAYSENQIKSDKELQFAVLVQPGDSLSKIAQKYYGASSEWTSVWQENSQIKSPDNIEVGSTIYLKRANIKFAKRVIPSKVGATKNAYI